MMHRQGQDMLGQVFSVRQPGGAIQLLKNRLLVQSPGIMHAAGDALFLKVLGQGAPITAKGLRVHQDAVLMPGME